jgi:RNA exonuclease 1
MWPSIPAFRPFGHVPCPAAAKCDAINCLFSHEAIKQKPQRETSIAASTLQGEREAKRPKLDESTKKVAQAAPAPARSPAVFVGTLGHKKTSRVEFEAPAAKSNGPSKDPHSTAKLDLPRSATKPVSPPPKAAAIKEAPDPEVRLTPRQLTKDPVQFTKRWTYLKTLREHMNPLNDKIRVSADPADKKLHLTKNQLNKLAIDEEAKFGESNLAVYENVVKHRILTLKKMTLDAWAKERRDALPKENGEEMLKERPKPKPVETGLTPNEEVLFLSHLTSDQNGLDAHGYVTKQPTQSELDDTWKALAACDYWEKCDRCNTRFQVFPDRREEDGALTAGGKCQHHWGKKTFPKRVKNQMSGPSKYTCCDLPVGSAGCTTHDTHVFKVSGDKRLSTIMPFLETPENDKADTHTAVCFDCEMGYTTKGLELLRITAASWPSHKPILDVLVRPLGHVLDLNTRFSGVTSEQFLNAEDYNPKDPAIDPKNLRIVDSPYIARDLFVSLISPRTPLLGHALENDLNSIRLIHPVIVDTIILYPHPSGLPARLSLRGLAKTHLGLNIQQAGAAGHDSYEDAWATGELVRHKVATEWKKMKRDGWSINEDGVYPPLPSGPLPASSSTLYSPAIGAATGGKRDHDQYVEEDDIDYVFGDAKRQREGTT